jgi:hypothetical protein
MQKLTVIGWLFFIALVTGVGTGFAGKPLQIPFSILHKLSAMVCLVFLVLRIAAAVRLFESRPLLIAALAIFTLGFLAAFASGIVQSIPAQAGALWLNLHRASAIVATAACIAAWRLTALQLR